MMFSLTPMVVHDRSPLVVSDEDPGDGTGALLGVEDPHLVVGEVDPVEGGEAGPERAAQRGVRAR